MKRYLFLLVIGLLLLGGTTVVYAQDRADQASQVEQAKRFLQWMQNGAGRLDQELLQARREQNTRKINCIEDRLSSLKELATESEGLYQKLRAYALQQRTADANKLFAKLVANQKLAEQIIKLVEDCFHNINNQGGFVEALEEWLGEPPGEEGVPDPTDTQPRSGVPQPVPNEFTPPPVSEEQP